MKKFLLILLAMSLILCMTACGGKEKRIDSDDNYSDNNYDDDNEAVYIYEDDNDDYSNSYDDDGGNECYVCGDSGASHKYGSYYYCTSCYAMVKTVVEEGDDYDYSYDDDDYDYDYDDDDGYSYDPDDDYYSSNDHNNDGKINDDEFQDALGDYMDDLMGY